MSGINRHLCAVAPQPWAMKVAFASTDYHYVDQHFGITPRLVIYGVREDEVMLLKVADFAVTQGHQPEKLACRIDALEDCVTLYCVAIGDTLFRQLLQVGVRAVRVPPQTSISYLLTQIQQHWSSFEDRHQRRQKRDAARVSQWQNPGDWLEDYGDE
ncbi:NifB/NifX family molybdenum-iron cluster-binding protein [Pantoea sp. B65]|uniref:NifB/NifX family molybdenum-iron cluster-binding protein n=1 Tax=Pantoea sp. B65 TaxID=2813359 RepID=UPI0039B608EE